MDLYDWCSFSCMSTCWISTGVGDGWVAYRINWSIGKMVIMWFDADGYFVDIEESVIFEEVL